jgi:hypothetical protein
MASKADAMLEAIAENLAQASETGHPLPWSQAFISLKSSVCDDPAV